MAKTSSWEFTITRPITDENMDKFLNEFHRGLFPKFWNLFSLSKIRAFQFLNNHVRSEHLSEVGTYRLMITIDRVRAYCTLNRKI